MSGITAAAQRAGRAGRGLLPTGQLLTPEVWARRHQGIVWLLWAHVAGIAVFAVVRGSAGGPGRRRPCHLSGGLVEAHFHRQVGGARLSTPPSNSTMLAGMWAGGGPMTSVRATTIPGTTASGPPRARFGDDLAAALLGTWVVGGLFLDGWAHVNQPDLETFFSPWHGVFYTGFIVSTVVLARLVTRYQRGRFDPALVPAGYGLGLIGAGLFVLGGVADMVWHTLFGIEVGVAALLSPSHLLLLVGGLLMVTSPVRSAWASPDLPARAPAARLFPALWATTLTTAVLLFFFQYLSAFVTGAPSAPAEGPDGLLDTIVGVASVLVTNLILVAPVLLLARRWRLPFGTVALLATVGAAAMTSVRELALGALVPAMLVGGLAADLLLARLRPGPDRPGAFRAAAVLVPLVLWGAWTAVYTVAYGMAWPPELWAGVLGMACLSGLGLSLLALPPAVPDRAWDPISRA